MIYCTKSGCIKKPVSLWYPNRVYFAGFLLLLGAGFITSLISGNPGTFPALNAYHPFWLNVFFINYTFTGDGIFATALVALLFFYFKKKQKSLTLLYSFLLSGIAVQLIKNFFNSAGPRLFFEKGQYLFFADDISLANNPGFPSGHTATAFAIATVFILGMRSGIWQLPILAAAALAGYSRIYLAGDFLSDVLTGALIGTCSGVVSHMLVSGKVRMPGFTRTRARSPQREHVAYN